MKNRLTYYDSNVGHYNLTDKGRRLTEHDLINAVGNLEDKVAELTAHNEQLKNNTDDGK